MFPHVKGCGKLETVESELPGPIPLFPETGTGVELGSQAQLGVELLAGQPT